MARDMAIRGPYLSSPAWMGDFGHPEALIPAGGKIDASLFFRPDSVFVKLNGAKLAGVTSITVDALVAPVNAPSGTIIPNGTVLNFGSGLSATVNDAAIAAGDTTITTLALAADLADNLEARYAGIQRKVIASGKVVGRTFAERSAGTNFGPADDSDDEMYIVAFDRDDIDIVNDVDLYRYGHLVYENFLPDWTNSAVITTAIKAFLRAHYVTALAEA